MTHSKFLSSLLAALTVEEIECCIADFEAANPSTVGWHPFGGRLNNRGTIEAASDSGRSIIERLTNGVDALLEREHALHANQRPCNSPKEAAQAWFGVPQEGLQALDSSKRRSLSQDITVTLLPGEGKASRTIEVRDKGVGVAPDRLAGTILSLNESNKIQKRYLAGAYGQGGSSTYAFCKYALVVSRTPDSEVCFAVVRYDDPPPEDPKEGRYVYIVDGNDILRSPVPLSEFPAGTLVRHFGYDLSRYGSPFGPNSLYGLLNQVLFDPVLPVWFDNRVNNYRRVIKGSRNALNGAVDEGDDSRKGPELSHAQKMFYVQVADFGQIGVEYWVLAASDTNKRPSASFVNPGKPIILSYNGQNQDELSGNLIRKDCELPYLSQRLIVHIDCNALNPGALRALFVSNREGTKKGVVLHSISAEIVQMLRSDDMLVKLNAEARDTVQVERDEEAEKKMRKEVARILKIQGLSVSTDQGGGSGDSDDVDTKRHPRQPRPQPQPIEIKEPPQYIRIVWPENEAISLYGSQRRYVRIETDASSDYWNPKDADASRINFIVSGDIIKHIGSAPLSNGRMRVLLDAPLGAALGQAGELRVEMMRRGLPILHDARNLEIVVPPPPKPGRSALNLPPYEWRPVTGLDDPSWANLGWPDSVDEVAYEALEENGVLVIHYSTVFPKYYDTRSKIESRNTGLAESFRKRYEIWLAVHALLEFSDQKGRDEESPEGDDEVSEKRNRMERKRLAVVASLVAAQEIQHQPREVVDDES
jgi:hypothetical protein